jgi:predicted unusual protein kinase regulating ubiquinone biosynthesis (AarF/ABC1/UbiB family)
MDDDEASSVLNRLRRYAGVATGVTGVALRGAGRWIGGKGPFDIGNAADLARMLGGLRGPLMKGAQIAGSLPDVFPPAFAAELAKLQSNAPEMGASFVRRRMAAELGPAWQTKFKSFDLAAAHAASLGQVHRAVGLDGRALACKLQYPDMQSTVDADLTQLKTILSLQRAAERNFDTREIAVEVEERIREELDYVREAAHMRLFGHMFKGDDAIAVPAPVAALSTGRLLTMTWLDGAPFRDALKRPQAERDAIAQTLYRAWFAPLFRFGVVHGDAHFGNYTIRADGGINLLDFGCVRIFPERVVQGLLDLHHAVSHNDDALAAKAYAAWGFTDVTAEFVDKMNVWAKLAFGATLEDRERPLGDATSLSGGVEQIWAMKQRFRKGDPVRPPREFVFIARALVGVGAALIHLDAKLNWHRMYKDLTAGFDAEALATRQTQAKNAAGLAHSDPTNVH